MEAMLSDFQTFDDPSLARMREEALRFMAELRELPKSARPAGRWLAFLGVSGTGKTMVADRIYRYWDRYLSEYTCPITGATLYREGLKIEVPAMVRQIKSAIATTGSWIEDAVAAPFLFLDEIGASHDKSGFVADLLFQILTARIGKPTLLTGNLLVKDLAEIDVRISSRLIRDDNVCVQVTAMDYALRKHH
jgi:DNA replication protein DnaC